MTQIDVTILRTMIYQLNNKIANHRKKIFNNVNPNYGILHGAMIYLTLSRGIFVPVVIYGHTVVSPD